MPPTIIFAEYAVINDVSFGGHAAWIESYAPLLEDPPILGENVHIPGTPGRTAYGKDADELHCTFVVNVDGDYNFADDTVSANPKQQLLENRQHLRNELGTGLLATGDGTVDFEWHQPDGSTVITVQVQVLGLIGWSYPAPTFARTTLDLIVPAGLFEAIGS